MDIVSSAAAVAQLLGQAIKLWQQISQARQAVRAAPKALADTTEQLCGLLDTMRLVEREPNLHNPDVDNMLKLMYGAATELNHILGDMAALQRKSPLRQSWHALRWREGDEDKLNDIMGRLKWAKADLLVRMNAVHVRMTGEVIEGMVRVEHGVQTAMQGRDGADGRRHHLMLERNETGGEADQLNGIAAIEHSKMSTTAKVADNKALGKSRQKNVILGGTGLLKMLASPDAEC